MMLVVIEITLDCGQTQKTHKFLKQSSDVFNMPKIIRTVLYALLIINIAPTPSAVAHEVVTDDHVQLTQNDRRRNTLASKISVCSEIKGVTSDTISSFYAKHFNGWQPPETSDTLDERFYNWGQNILFIATDGSVGAKLRNCLEDHHLVKENLIAYVKDEVQWLGKPVGAKYGYKAPSYLGPADDFWSYSKNANWQIVLYVSITEELYRTNHALTFFFGLDYEVCKASAACEFSIPVLQSLKQ